MEAESRKKIPIDSRGHGLLVLAAVLLVVILLRWGTVLPWSAR